MACNLENNRYWKEYVLVPAAEAHEQEQSQSNLLLQNQQTGAKTAENDRQYQAPSEMQTNRVQSYNSFLDTSDLRQMDQQL